MGLGTVEGEMTASFKIQKNGSKYSSQSKVETIEQVEPQPLTGFETDSFSDLGCIRMAAIDCPTKEEYSSASRARLQYWVLSPLITQLLFREF